MNLFIYNCFFFIYLPYLYIFFIILLLYLLSAPFIPSHSFHSHQLILSIYFLISFVYISDRFPSSPPFLFINFHIFLLFSLFFLYLQSFPSISHTVPLLHLTPPSSYPPHKLPDSKLPNPCNLNTSIRRTELNHSPLKHYSLSFDISLEFPSNSPFPPSSQITPTPSSPLPLLPPYLCTVHLSTC